MVIIYHANCNDGYCCAWLLHQIYPNARFIPMNYGGTNPPEFPGEDIIIADFSFKRDILLEMHSKAKSLIVLDHHKTAEEDLKGLDFCVFDMSKSGARLMQEHFKVSSNWLVNYTEDRDLWKWELPESRAVNAALASYPRDFEVWTRLDNTPWLDLAEEGTAILRYEQQLIASHVNKSVEVEFKGYKILTVNATVLFSDIAGQLAKDRPFAMAWFRRQDGKYQYSLRSTGVAGSVDVSEIAKSMGGGGHRNAAGFESDTLVV